MKTFFLLSMLAFSVAVTAQYEPIVAKGGGFDVKAGSPTGDTFTLGQESFDVFQTSSGSRYLIAEGKNGKQYPVWLGTPTEDKFEGQVVYVTRGGSYCVYVMGGNGFPYPKWLKKTA